MRLKPLALALLILSTPTHAISIEELRDSTLLGISTVSATANSVAVDYEILRQLLVELEDKKFIDPGLPNGQLAMNVDQIDEIMEGIQTTQKSMGSLDKVATNLKKLEVLGYAADAYTVYSAVQTFRDEDSSASDTAEAIRSLAAVGISRIKVLNKFAGSALLPYEAVKLGTELTLNAARDVAEQVSENYQADITSFQNRMRSTAHNIIVQNLEKPEAEVKELVFSAIKKLATEYSESYQKGGTMYNVAYGNGAILGFIATGGGVTQDFNDTQAYFAKYETLGMDARQYAESLFDRKHQELTTYKAVVDLTEKLQSELTTLYNTTTELQNNLSEFSNLTTPPLENLALKESQNNNVDSTGAVTDYQSSLSDEDKQAIIEHHLASDNSESTSENYEDATNIPAYGYLQQTELPDDNIWTLNISDVRGNQQNGFMQTGVQFASGDAWIDAHASYESDPDYSYTEWGRWNSGSDFPSHFDGNAGYLVIGIPTPEDYLTNKRGTASYQGDVIGSYTGGSEGDIQGNVSLTADFDTDEIWGALALERVYALGETEPLHEVEFDTSINQNGSYSGILSSQDAAISGSLKGQFFGPTADETGGVFSYAHQILSEAYGSRTEIVHGSFKASETNQISP